jgi:hypothetical protein
MSNMLLASVTTLPSNTEQEESVDQVFTVDRRKRSLMHNVLSLTSNLVGRSIQVRLRIGEKLF